MSRCVVTVKSGGRREGDSKFCQKGLIRCHERQKGRQDDPLKVDVWGEVVHQRVGAPWGDKKNKKNKKINRVATPDKLKSRKSRKGLFYLYSESPLIENNLVKDLLFTLKLHRINTRMLKCGYYIDMRRS